MFMKMPSARYLKSLGPKAFASESTLQMFFERRLCPKIGLRVVCSSRAGHGRMGNIDTLAIDHRRRPVILEYKRDLVGEAAIAQLSRYRKWLLAHKDRFAKAVVAKWGSAALDWTRIYLVSVGYRYKYDPKRWLSFPGTHFRPLRYGYGDDYTLLIHKVVAGDPKTYGHERAPKLSKRSALRKHLARTTDAGRRAFARLTDKLRKRGLELRYPGKNRVRFWSPEGLRAEVTFATTGLQLFFRSDRRTRDPEGRVARSKKSKLNRTMSIVSPADVSYAVKLLCH